MAEESAGESKSLASDGKLFPPGPAQPALSVRPPAAAFVWNPSRVAALLLACMVVVGLTACSDSNSPAKVQAAIKTEVQRACDVAVSTASAPKVSFEEAWKESSSPSKVQSLAAKCVEQAKAGLTEEVKAEVRRACDAAVATQSAPVVETKEPWSLVASEAEVKAFATACVSNFYSNQYLDLVAPSNCAQERWNVIEGNITGADELYYVRDWSRIQAELLPALGAAGDALIAFYEGLVEAKWPTDVKADIDRLVQELTADAAALRVAAAAKTFDELSPLPFSDISTAAAVVRARLGLPSNLTDEAIDWCARPPNSEPVP